MVGLPNTRVVPPGWAAHHRSTANSTMTGVCELTGPSGPPTWDNQEGTPGTVLATDVPCRVQQLTGENEDEAVGQDVHTRDYLVTLPLHLVPALTITDNAPWVTITGYLPGHEQDGDPHLVGRRLKVLSVQHGTLLWERDVICRDDLTNPGGDA